MGLLIRRLFGTLLSSQVTGAHQSQNLFTGCAFGASVVKVQEFDPQGQIRWFSP